MVNKGKELSFEDFKALADGSKVTFEGIRHPNGIADGVKVTGLAKRLYICSNIYNGNPLSPEKRFGYKYSWEITSNNITHMRITLQDSQSEIYSIY